MTSSHHAPYGLGHTRTTMGRTEGSEGVTRSGSRKASPSSDCRLQPACTKSESLVIADQHAALYTPPVTPRKPLTPEAGRPSKAGAMTGVKS